MRVISKQKFKFEKYSDDGLTILESAKTGDNGVLCTLPNWVAGCDLFKRAVGCGLIIQLDAAPDIIVNSKEPFVIPDEITEDFLFDCTNKELEEVANYLEMEFTKEESNKKKRVAKIMERITITETKENEDKTE